MSFDYGATPAANAGFKNPEEGIHSARLRSVIHLGMFEESFGGKLKPAAPEAVAIFELKGKEDYADDGSPLEIDKAFPIKLGDKATVAKIRKALEYPPGSAAGFDDLIGKACSIELKGSKELGDDGKPKYVNFSGISALSSEFREMVRPLEVEGVGHCTFENLTEEAIKELNPVRHVAMILMKSLNYSGSKAEEIVKKMKADDPSFATKKDKDADEQPKVVEGNVQNTKKPSVVLDDSEEF